MSLIDKVVSAVTPNESAESRDKARSNAQRAAGPGDWLSLVIEHHREVETAFAVTRNAGTATERRAAQKWLGILLTGHANAEESVVYPALALHGEKGHADTGYTEQAAVKTQMAALDELDPVSKEYLDKLEHIRDSVAHHMYEEEHSWFIELKHKLSVAEQSKLTNRYREEFDRYVGHDKAA